jgi:glycosyltransferase involved in cell wall biosynthesis
VVTPSYNQARFLEQTIRSVLLQGYPNLEYMVVDGGSTDGSLHILHKYEPWLAWWVSEKDSGQSHAINKGWNRATGDLLAWLNSDDYYAPGALHSAAHAFLEAGPGVGMVHARACWVGPDGQPVMSGGRPFSVVDVLRNAIPPAAQPAVFLRASVVRRLRGLAEEFHMAMDWDLYVRVALESEVVFVPELWAYATDWEAAKSRSPVLGFGPEVLEICRRLYRRPDLPAEVRAVKDDALAAAAVWSSLDHCRAGRYWRMQVCFFQALARNYRLALERAGPYHAPRLALGPLLPLAGAVRRLFRT